MKGRLIAPGSKSKVSEQEDEILQLGGWFSLEGVFKASQWVQNLISQTWHHVSYLWLGDMREGGHLSDTLRERAKSDIEQYIGRGWLGPPKIGVNFAVLSLSHPDSKVSERQLDTFISLSEPGARSPYQVLNMLAGCHFILSDNSLAGLDLHKEFVRYINPSRILEECLLQIPQMLEVFEKSGDMEKHGNSVKLIVKGIYFKAILGLTPTEELLDVLVKVEDGITVPRVIFKNFSRYTPSVMKFRASVDAACQRFIVLRVGEIKELFRKGVRTILTEHLRRIFPDKKDWSEISEGELKEIGRHVLFRNAIFLLFALDNAAHVTSVAALGSLIGLNNDKRVQRLAQYLRTNPNLDLSHLDPIFATILQALYMNALRHSKFDSIFRYTQKGVNTPELKIPPRTLIGCSLDVSGVTKLDQLLVGRSFYFVSYENIRELPSDRTLAAYISSHADPYEVRPIIIRVARNYFYIYGLTNIETNRWKLTCLDDLDIPLSNLKCSEIIELNGKDMSDNLLALILEKKAHQPFTNPERIKFKVGDAKFAFFGGGLRKCPAENAVGLLAKQVIVDTLRTFKAYEPCRLMKKHAIAIRVHPQQEEIMIQSVSRAIGSMF